MNPKSYSKQNQTFFYILFAGILVLSFLVIKAYLSLAILAFLLTALYSPAYKIFHKIFRIQGIASVMATLVMFISILIPVMFVGYLGYNQVLEFNTDIQNFLKANNLKSDDSKTTTVSTTNPVAEVNNRLKNGSVFIETDTGATTAVDPNTIGNVNINEFINKVNNNIQKVPFLEDKELSRQDVDGIVNKVIGPATNFLADSAIKIGGSSLNIITSIILFVMLVITFFPAHKKLEDFYKTLSPLDDEIDESYIRRVTAMGVAMIKGTFIVAIIQGIISGIFLYIAGVDYVVFWTIMTIVVSIIPIGSGIINIPIAIILIITGNIWQGSMIILGNIFVVGQVDQVLRPRLVPKGTEIPHALTLLSVLGGVKFFGIMGFIYGPIVIIVLITTFEVYLKYYKDSLKPVNIPLKEVINEKVAVTSRQ